MDGKRFDNLTRRLAAGASRRSVLKGLAAGLTGGALRSGSAVARTRRGDPQVDGSACQTGADCASRFCAHGICCDTACPGLCESCASGVCTPVVGAPDAERGTCPGSGSCAATCDGVTTTSCGAFPGAETICANSTCAEGWQTQYVCGGNGTCTPTTERCTPYGCDPTGVGCGTTCAADTDCAVGYHCDDARCRPDAGLGSACDEDSDCQHGHCAATADGTTVCCTTACDGTCETCGSDGICGPSPNGWSCARDGGTTCCGGDCVDLQTDAEHCRTCDTVCPGVEHGQAVCISGDCDIACLPDFMPCGDACQECCTPEDCPEPDPGSCQARTCLAGVCGVTALCPLEQCCAGTCCSEEQVCVESACAFQETFSEPGEHTWRVPADVECATFELAGAQGGSSSFGPGGQGGRLRATLHLTSGDELTVTVGARGGLPSGTSGGAGGSGKGAGGDGGDSGGTFAGAGGGGGGTEVVRAAVRLLVAGGGGGGAGGNNGGAGGGLNGGAGGALHDVDAGAGGTQSGPGAGGLPGGQGGAGADGGNGGSTTNGFAGGGGGGGYFGGGGGAYGNSPSNQNGGGGGGGSGFISDDTTIVVAGELLDGGQAGDGLIRITYPVACPA